MLTYVSRFWSGGFEPFWPHVALLSLTVLASLAVGAGIIFERPTYSAAFHRVAFWLVVGGVIVEAVCTIFLFVFDEGISTSQQSRIIALQARSWTEAQFDAIQEIRGKVPGVGVFAERNCLECSMFADYIEIALHTAGVELYGDDTLDWLHGTGIHVSLPQGSDLSNDPLLVILRKAGLNPAASFHIKSEWSRVRTDIPVIFVGEKFPLIAEFPFYPKGASRWTMLPLKNPDFKTPKDQTAPQ
jgi:hypothetical protein